MSDIYLTDTQIAVRLGMTLEEWVAVAAVLERSGLPQRSPLFNRRRHWPALQDFLYARERRTNQSVPAEKDKSNVGFKSTLPRPKEIKKRDNLILLGSHKARAEDGLSAADEKTPRQR